MTQPKSMPSVDRERRKPPMPEFLFKLANPVLKAILLSPLHSGMSKRLMVLTFTGRKSGKRYTTPVGYVRPGASIYVFTHSPWRKNFTKPAPVVMRIEGKDVSGTGQLVNDPQRIKLMIQALTAANGETMARQMGFWVENLDTAGPQQIQAATEGTFFIEIQTGETQNGPASA